MMEQKKISLRSGRDVAEEAEKKIKLFQSGVVKPIPTGIEHMDEALLGGLLPGSILTIAGYSFQGKTYELEMLQRNIADNCPDVIMLHCAWELEGFKSITRDLSYRSNKSVKELLFTPLDSIDAPIFEKTLDSYKRDNLWVQPEPVTSDQFEDDVMWLIESYPKRRLVVCIDNLENILVDRGSQKDCMDKMLYRINVLKKRHPFISFVVLNQLNNDILARIDNLKGHAPIQKDLYGTGQLFKISDVVVVKVMPEKFGIKDKYMVFGKKYYAHLDSLKLPSRTKTTSFDPIGTIFYFYLKARETDKDFQNVRGKRIYTREERGLPPVEEEVSKDMPVFGKDENPAPEVPIVISEAVSKQAREDFENAKNEDPPF